MNEELNLPKILFDISGTFEFELLIELMLKHWEHPLAADDEFRNDVMESAASVLHQAAEGEAPTSDMRPNDVNLIFSVWHVESLFVAAEPDSDLKKSRERWLDAIKRSLPSCFCDPEFLG